MLAGPSAPAEQPKQQTIALNGRRYVIVKTFDHDCYDLRLDLASSSADAPLSSWGLLFAGQDARNGYTLSLKDATLSLRAVKDGRPALLGSAPVQAADETVALKIKRRHSMLAIVLGGKNVLEVLDSSYSRGSVGIDITGGAPKVSRFVCQPVPDIVYTDDFMRTEEEQELGSWSKVRGDWYFWTVMERTEQNPDARIRAGKMPQAERSANPFTFVGSGKDGAIVTTGHSFWDNYVFSVSAKGTGGELGLVFHYRDAKDYFAFEWELASYTKIPSRMRLVKVGPKGEEAIAQRTVVGRTNQWYSLSIETMGSRIKAKVDGLTVFDVLDARSIGGSVGLYTGSEKVTFFDDVKVHSNHQQDLDCRQMVARHGRSVKGQWQALDLEQKAATGKQDTTYVQLRSPQRGEGIYLLGDREWSGQVFTTRVMPLTDAKAVGIVFAHRDAKNYWLFRWGERKELIRVAGGRPSVAVGVEGRCQPGHWYQLAVDLSADKTVAVYLDDALEIRSRTTESLAGGVGFYSDGGALFGGLSVGRERECDWEKLVENPIFADDPYMQGWASPKWAWVPLSEESLPPVQDYTYSEYLPRVQMDYPVMVEGLPPIRVRVSKAKGPEETAPPALDQLEFIHKGDFYGAFTIELPLQDGLLLAFGAEAPGPDTGYAVEVAAPARKLPLEVKRMDKPSTKIEEHVEDGEKEADAVDETIRQESRPKKKVSGPKPATEDHEAITIRLKRGGEEVAQFEHEGKPLEARDLTVNRDGAYVWLSMGEEEVLSYRDPKPLEGRRVKLLSKGRIDLAAVSVRRDHVKDYLFADAPVDWTKVGFWEVTNRFACDPRWSHFSGRSERAAILWNKFMYPGDVTLEFYAGMRMRQGRSRRKVKMYYPRVGDLNATIAAQGEDLPSGYNFLLGAWDPFWSETWTRMLRQDEPVSQTDQQLLPRTRASRGSSRLVRLGWDPGGRAIHGAWYYVKIRKIGNTLKYYFDNLQVLEHTDPSPLAGSRLGIWTYKNDIMIARVKVSYEKKALPTDILQVDAQTVAEDSRAAPQPPITIASATHPGVLFDFEGNLGGWEDTNDEESAALAVDSSTHGSGRSSLKLTNLYPGGDFGAKVAAPDLPLNRVASFRFSYRVPPTVKVNLYLKVSDDTFHRGHYFVRFTGEERSNEAIKCIGQIEDVKADDQWHVATFDLASAVREHFPYHDEVRLEELVIGNLHDGYLNAGIGGNGSGVRYYLDNFEVATVSGNAARFNWSSTLPDVVGYSFCVDSKRDTVPETELVQTTQTTVRGLKAGIAYAHVRAKRKDGTWTQTAHLPIHVSAESTSVASVAPADGAHWGGERIRVRFSSPSASLPPLHRCRLHVDGQRIPSAPGNLEFDWHDSALIIDLAAAGMALTNGQKVSFALDYPNAFTEASRFATHTWSYVMDYERDTRPPSTVVVRDAYHANFTFEDLEHSWGHTSGDIIALRTSETAAAGRFSLKVENRVAGSACELPIPIRPFNAGENPILCFDYRIPAQVRTNFVLTVGDSEYSLVFTDSSGSSSALGAVRRVVRDDEWHHAQVPIGRLVNTNVFQPDAEAFLVSSIGMADEGYQGNAPQARYYLDNVRLIRTISTAAGYRLHWQAADMAGIRGYSFAWSQQSDEVPDEKIDAERSEMVFKDVPEGLQYLHVRAQDRAGNWGPVAHYQFLVDNTPPKIVGCHPAPDSESASPTIRATIEEKLSGLAPYTLKLTMGDKACPLDTALVGYRPTRGQIHWDWRCARGPLKGIVPDGTVMKFSVASIADFAGNATGHVDWRWTLKHNLDRLPPLAPEVKALTQDVFRCVTFSTGDEGCSSYGSELVERHYDGTKKDFCLRAVQRYATGSYGAVVIASAFDAAKFPFVSLEYRLPKNAKPSVHAMVRGAWRSLGAIPGAIADEQWRASWFDLDRLVARYFRKGQPHVVERLAIADYYLAAARNADYYFSSRIMYLDNICVVGRGRGEPVFELSAVDESGVQAYSYILDRNWDKVAGVDDMARAMGERIAEGGAAEIGADVDFGFDKFQATVPDTNADLLGPREELKPLTRKGMWYLHIRAQDGAGNWGAVAHYPYYCEQPAKDVGEEEEEELDPLLDE